MIKQYVLPYSYDALEPHIDALTMETHYAKHHAGYTKNLIDALEKAGITGEITLVLRDLEKIEDPALRASIRNNGGGYYNHNIYFSTIGPNGGQPPMGAFGTLIDKSFGSFDSLKEKLSTAAMGRFGSGWAWLSANPAGELYVSSSPNQDNPLMEGEGFAPIFGIDVWEHAYYLKYKNMRADYVKAFFNVVLWEEVEKNYQLVTAGK